MELTKLAHLALSPSGFIFDPQTGNSYTANDTALAMITALRDGKSAEEIITAITDEYEIDADTADHDLSDVMELLRTNYLV